MGIDPSQFSGKFADSEFRSAESGALTMDSQLREVLKTWGKLSPEARESILAIVRGGARNLEPYSPGTDKADRSLQINACTETKSEDNV
jgi:hypothetical protein